MNTYTIATLTFELDTAVNVAGLTTLKGAPCDGADAIIGGDHLTIESPLVCDAIDKMPAITTGTLTVNPPALTPLCTLTDVENALNTGMIIGGTNTATVERLIPLASSLIRKRESVTVPQVAEARTIPFVDGPTIYPHELASVTSVKDVSGNELAFTEIAARGRVLWIELASPVCGAVSVTGTWGYATVPGTYVRATAVAVAYWYLQATQDERGFYGNHSALPKDALELLGSPLRV